jgi:hypothetical protein
MRTSLHRFLSVAAVFAAGASAEVIYETTGPFGGPFGLWGADVFTGQAVAQRFESPGQYRLDLARLWMMSNDFAGTVDEFMTVSVQTDAGGPGESYPSGLALATVTIEITAIGWDPVLEQITYAERPWIFPGERYWVVCESQAAGGEDPVWTFASEGLGFNAFRPWDATWQPGGTGAELTMIVEATPSPCLADLAGPVGVLDLADIQAFVAAFIAGHAAADIAEPRAVFDLSDLAAFVETFLSGCG